MKTKNITKLNTCPILGYPKKMSSHQLPSKENVLRHIRWWKTESKFGIIAKEAMKVFEDFKFTTINNKSVTDKIKRLYFRYNGFFKPYKAKCNNTIF